MAKIVNTANFRGTVEESNNVVVVDFFATWCGPCKMLAPTIEEIAKEYEGKVKVGKVNIDEYAPLAIKYGVASIPTVILFKDGQAVDKSVGFVPKATIEEMLK